MRIALLTASALALITLTACAVQTAPTPDDHHGRTFASSSVQEGRSSGSDTNGTTGTSPGGTPASGTGQASATGNDNLAAQGMNAVAGPNAPSTAAPAPTTAPVYDPNLGLIVPSGIDPSQVGPPPPEAAHIPKR